MESETLIVQALLDQGGLLGVVGAISFVWSLFFNKQNKDNNSEISEKEKALSSKIEELKDKYEERIKIFEKDILELKKDLHHKNEEVSDAYVERIDDLKNLISDYHTLATDTSQTLEKIKFYLMGNEYGKKNN